MEFIIGTLVIILYLSGTLLILNGRPIGAILMLLGVVVWILYDMKRKQ